jgi:hypothetical protein
MASPFPVIHLNGKLSQQRLDAQCSHQEHWRVEVSIKDGNGYILVFKGGLATNRLINSGENMSWERLKQQMKFPKTF